MSVNINVSGKVYNGVQNIIAKTDDNTQVNFLLQGVEPSKARRNYVTFIDYDGTVVASYTKAEFLALTSLPANPTHNGLIAEGWNWTLVDAQSFVEIYGELVIGQMYHTASGKTEYDIRVNDATGYTATLNNNEEKDWGDGITDTNTTHTYTAAGNYTIKMGGVVLPNTKNSKKLTAVRIAAGVTEIPSNAFYTDRYLEYATIPVGVTIPYSGAFQGCISLTSITVPACVTILAGTFVAQCYALQYISLPKSITDLGGSFVNACYALKSIIVPYGVTALVSSTFYECKCLERVTLPETITDIGSLLFAYCENLYEMTVLATTPPNMPYSGAIPSFITKIYIQNGTLAAYEAATNWSSFSGKFVELPA